MKNIGKFSIVTMMVVMLTGCASATGLTYSFDVDETGDTIEILFDTSDGYYIEEYDTESVGLEGQIFIVCDSDETIISIGTFEDNSLYSSYNWSISMDEDATMIETKDEAGENNYLFWNYGDTEFNYIISVDGSSTCIDLGNNVSLETAQDIFSRMTITAK